MRGLLGGSEQINTMSSQSTKSILAKSQEEYKEPKLNDSIQTEQLTSHYATHVSTILGALEYSGLDTNHSLTKSFL